MNKLIFFLIFGLTLTVFSHCETSNEPQVQNRAWSLFILLNRSSSASAGTATGTATGTNTGTGAPVGPQPPPPPPSVQPILHNQNTDSGGQN
ncbi:MAG TPA: hypothetical protein PL048_05085 [Leptospiraceae bacterium]|nr:hypothetical protein [Leptospiraceae bacterium]HMY69298.1 hypothetical protein [Leptospiraceae bacterium]HMZ58124.1 hypothetical protein [Leptospiraceae bacterium]HNF13304.1 hypothetical protein [Leptospiraceae bacterium]HNJ00077.1 hypothetical protein [Leptospiraceae bacterium]